MEVDHGHCRAIRRQVPRVVVVVGASTAGRSSSRGRCTSQVHTRWAGRRPCFSSSPWPAAFRTGPTRKRSAIIRTDNYQKPTTYLFNYNDVVNHERTSGRTSSSSRVIRSSFREYSCLDEALCLLPAFSVSLLCGVPSAYGQTPRPERPFRGCSAAAWTGRPSCSRRARPSAAGTTTTSSPMCAEGEAATHSSRGPARLDIFSAGLNHSSAVTASTRVPRRELQFGTIPPSPAGSSKRKAAPRASRFVCSTSQRLR